MAKARKKETAGTMSGSAVGTMAEEASPAVTHTAGEKNAAAPDRGRVAMRAYELYLARGAMEGAALDDWLAAERELSSGNFDRTDE